VIATDVREISQTLGRLDDFGRAGLFTEARTANSLSSNPVSDAELSDIWNLAKWAPSAANTKPLRVLYVRPGRGRDRLLKHMSDGNRARTASAAAAAVLAVDTRFHEPLAALLPFRPEITDRFERDEETRASTETSNATGWILHPLSPCARPCCGTNGRLRRRRYRCRFLSRRPLALAVRDLSPDWMPILARQ
jgi:nitroreductase